MRARDHSRGVRLVLGASLLLLLAAPAALAGDGAPCEFEHEEVRPLPGAPLAVEMERRECPEGRSLALAVTAIEGRNSVEWYDDERGRGLELFRPPYFVSWTDTERGCVLILYVFALGDTALECVAGAPPPPPYVPL